MRTNALLLAVAMAAPATPLSAQTPKSAARVDYADSAMWLCRPGRNDACAADLATTIVHADGTLELEPSPPAAANAPIDCFYVYPTVSNDTSANSDLIPGPEERGPVRTQFARLRTRCRTFAPVYRQVTLAALRGKMAGRDIGDDALAYGDVLDAWRYYLAHDNAGRGVVLIGHSQGSREIAQLLREEIDGRPAQRRLVSAFLLGWVVAVPPGRDVGGDYRSIPLCRTPSQTGCVVSFASFRDTVPPLPPGPAATIANVVSFGHARAGFVAACTNPAALGGGSAPLHAYLSTRSGSVLETGASTRWVTPAATISTPFVSVPGLLSARCESNELGSYLAVTVHGDPSDPRTDTISGDVMSGGVALRIWGLHLVDAALTMGDVVDLVGRQADAWAPNATSRPTARP